MPKHTFSIACSEDIVGGESKYKRIKLVRNLDSEEKTDLTQKKWKESQDVFGVK